MAWSSTRGGVALSSTEAEYYSMVSGATRGIGLQDLAEELGMQAKINLHTDSSGAKAMASRRGSGRVRHIEAKVLWLQAEVLKGRIKLLKVDGVVNPADLMTKYLHEDRIGELLKLMGLIKIA